MTEMLGIDHGWSHSTWKMNLMRYALHWNARKICFVVQVMLYGPNTDFFNIIHLSAIVRHVNCTFLHCFSTYLQLEMAIPVCILIFAHIFCLCMFLINCGCSDMACQMSSLLPWGGISLIWGSEIIFCSMYTSVCPQNMFSTSWIL